MTSNPRGAFRTVRLENFRRFEDTNAIELAPLTLVLGKNSSGKTTLLRALLLLKQLSSAISFEDIPLAGPLVDLGSYRELVHQGELSRDVSVSVDLNVRKARTSLPSRLIDEVNQLTRGELRAKIVLHWNKRIGRPQFSQIALESGPDHEPLVRFVRRSPTSFWMQTDQGRIVIDYPLSFMTLRRLPLDELGGLFQAPQPDTRSLRGISLYLLIDSLTEALGSIEHVGPLRDMPNRAYRLDQLNPESPTASVVNILERERSAQATLSAALRDMGMSGEVSLARLAPGYVGIVLTDPLTNRADNLADVGFGVSQVLPVLAAVATAHAGETLLIEQPELHLHPDAQGRLADVISRLTLERNCSVIIETHSEHLLLRILRRVADGSLRPEEIAIIVVEDGRVVNLGVDELGRLTGGGLPEGFFEEDWEDSLLLAQAAARRAGSK